MGDFHLIHLKLWSISVRPLCLSKMRSLGQLLKRSIKKMRLNVYGKTTKNGITPNCKIHQQIVQLFL